MWEVEGWVGWGIVDVGLDGQMLSIRAAAVDKERSHVIEFVTPPVPFSSAAEIRPSNLAFLEECLCGLPVGFDGFEYASALQGGIHSVDEGLEGIHVSPGSWPG